MTSVDSLCVFTICLPKNSVWDARRASQFMHQMLSGFDALTFRIVATRNAMWWQVIDMYGREHNAIESAIRASYPDAAIEMSAFGEGELANCYPLYRIVLKYQQVAETFLAPIVYADDIKSPDPLSHLAEIMGNLHDGERIIYTILVTGSAPEAYKKGEKHLTRKIYDGTITGFVDPYQTERYTSELTRVCRGKLAEHLYHVSILIQLDSPDRDHLNSLLTIDNQMVSFSRPQFGSLIWINDNADVHTVTDYDTDWNTCAFGQYDAIKSQEDGLFRKNKLKQQIDLILEAREIAALWHLPHEEFTAPTIGWSYANVRIPTALRGKLEGVCLGINKYAGREEWVFLPDRSGHISIIGKTGVGKTNLMHHLIDQDIRDGKGVALIDPHGQLVSDVLRYSIPWQREKDVIVLDLADEMYPAPLNLLSVPEGFDHGNAAGQLMGVLDRLYDFSSTPTVADTMSACLVTLLHADQPTIRDVGKLLRDEDYRDHLVTSLTNVAALEFWERFTALPNSHEQIIRPVLWRLRSLYSNSVLYPILCHPDTLDFSSLVAQNKILLVSLKANEARIPIREQHLLGLIMLTQLQQTMMLRSKDTEMFYLYVDEVQHFVTTTFDTLLSESRKNNVSLTTANQYLKQLTGGVLDALMGNVGTMITFQTGLEDAKLLAPYVAPDFDAEHLMHLNKYEAAITTRYKTQSLPAFSLKTLPPPTKNTPLSRAQEREAYLRRLSRDHYTPKSREEILAWLSDRYAKSNNVAGMSDDIVDFE
ncbi:MAG: type IV secretion system DNA-binding domain-containing protein [Anaerolineae bacterium]|nr:type IV secretion system DNA-binding domain-containing protein [Anaerolineae bacterium]